MSRQIGEGEVSALVPNQQHHQQQLVADAVSQTPTTATTTPWKVPKKKNPWATPATTPSTTPSTNNSGAVKSLVELEAEAMYLRDCELANSLQFPQQQHESQSEAKAPLSSTATTTATTTQPLSEEEQFLADMELAMRLSRDEEAIRQAAQDPSETPTAHTEEQESTTTTTSNDGASPSTDDDLAIALALQEQLDSEYDAHLNTVEYHANRTLGGKMKVSMEKYRTYPKDESPQIHDMSFEEEEEEWADDIDEAEFYDKKARNYRDRNGVIVTKHNLLVSGRRNRQKVESNFPVSFKSGDMKGSVRKDDDIRLSNKVYNQLKRFATKDAKKAARLRERKDHSTAVMAMDKATRLLVFKMINGGDLDEVHGVVSTGKESVIFHGLCTPPPQPLYPDVDEDDNNNTNNTAVAVEEEKTKDGKSGDVVDATTNNNDNNDGDDADVFTPEPSARAYDNDEDAHPIEQPSIPVQEECVLKVFKTTLTEFTDRQQFLHGDRRYDHRVGKQHARKLVRLWAEKEMANLTRLQRAGIPCPRVLGRRKHVLVLSFIGSDGKAAPKLKDVHWQGKSEKSARKCYTQVCDYMHRMYNECHLVHCDLSEYNMLWYSGKAWIIDVGQSVEDHHPRALAYLYRDCVNVTRFFEKNGFPDIMTAEELYEYITTKSITKPQGQEAIKHITISSKRQIRRVGCEDGSGDDASNIVLRQDTLTLEEILHVVESKEEKEDGDEEEDDEDEEDDGDDLLLA